MEPLFKVGDKVKVKKREHPSDWYPDKFCVDNMDFLSGRELYIVGMVIDAYLPEKHILEGDGVIYILEDYKMWCLTSQMFEKVEDCDDFSNNLYVKALKRSIQYFKRSILKKQASLMPTIQPRKRNKIKFNFK